VLGDAKQRGQDILEQSVWIAEESADHPFVGLRVASKLACRIGQGAS
jgi:hypothetical protein